MNSLTPLSRAHCVMQALREAFTAVWDEEAGYRPHHRRVDAIWSFMHQATSST
jgi:hypothetical protein